MVITGSRVIVPVMAKLRVVLEPMVVVVVSVVLELAGLITTPRARTPTPIPTPTLPPTVATLTLTASTVLGALKVSVRHAHRAGCGA